MGDSTALVASLQKLSVKQLQKMLQDKGRSCKGCTSKSDIIDELTRSVVVQLGHGTLTHDSFADVVDSWVNFIQYYPLTFLQFVALFLAVVYVIHLAYKGELQLFKKKGKKHVKSSSRDALMQRKKQ